MTAKFFEIQCGTGSSAGNKVSVIPADPNSWRPTIHGAVINGKVFITNDLANLLGFRAYDWKKPELKIGKIGLFFFSSTLFETAMYHIAYKRRNGREQAVADRNEKIVEFLLEM